MLSFMSSLLLAASTVASVPEYRGVVEGYYGRPWGTDGRISLMHFMGERNLNTFIYGPKDDPYHHAKWREPYPAQEAKDFRLLLDVAKAQNINFFWAIHLGDFKDEYEALFKKLEAMYAIGVRSFAVFFDDFGAANATLHATIGNRVITEFLNKKGDCSPLLICPNVYWGVGHPYQKELGAKLDKSAMIMWTGRTICSDVKAADVEKITADFQRPPFIWWNWPVNDYCRSKVLLGRLYGLDAATYSGVVLNPMENCEANKISIHSFAEWCKDPAHFDSQKAWEEGFAKIFKNPELAEAMKVFALHNSDQGANGHGYHREESVGPAAELCRTARRELKEAQALSDDTIEKLNRLFFEIQDAAFTIGRLLREENPQMYWELEGWIFDEMHQMEAGLTVLDIMDNADHRHCQKAVNRLFLSRHFQRLNQQHHVSKFRAATFENDRNHVKVPHTSNKEILPLIIEMLKVGLAREYKTRTGHSFDDTYGLKGLSGAKGFPKLVAFTDDDGAGLERVFEQQKVAPGEWFGLQVPELVQITSADIRLDNPKAAATAAIEVSRDGEKWEALTGLKPSGARFNFGLKPEEKWTFIRYRNAGTETVDLKLNLFTVKVAGNINPIDAILGELVDKR